jgi:hypothetical protein
MKKLSKERKVDRMAEMKQPEDLQEGAREQLETSEEQCIASKESATICHRKQLLFVALRERAARPQAHLKRSFSPKTHELPKGKGGWS